MMESECQIKPVCITVGGCLSQQGPPGPRQEAQVLAVSSIALREGEKGTWCAFRISLSHETGHCIDMQC